MSETQTVTIADFLMARIAEDVSALHIPDWHCTDSARGEGWGTRGSECTLCERYMFDGTESVTADAWEEHYEDAHAKRRVLAEVEAKRRIVEDFVVYAADYRDAPSDFAAGRRHAALLAVTRLVEPYADHPDYRQEWKP